MDSDELYKIKPVREGRNPSIWTLVDKNDRNAGLETTKGKKTIVRPKPPPPPPPVYPVQKKK